MNTRYFVALVLILTVVQISSSDTNSKLRLSNRAGFTTMSAIDIRTTRFLRASRSGSAVSGDEERGYSKIVKSLISPSETTPEKPWSWLKKGKSADIVFKRLQLC
ncbi:RxLR effector protein [Phytophthora megakarya]|uniref:RxLR effector protein n=1 Tax=Phytophthora megakarya TaxID=4795 RepID=A0A225VDL1_9STRA|nr:RxLR effector protein [Phytophthora megakarya]